METAPKSRGSRLVWHLLYKKRRQLNWKSIEVAQGKELSLKPIQSEFGNSYPNFLFCVRKLY